MLRRPHLRYGAEQKRGTPPAKAAGVGFCASCWAIRTAAQRKQRTHGGNGGCVRSRGRSGGDAGDGERRSGNGLCGGWSHWKPGAMHGHCWKRVMLGFGVMMRRLPGRLSRRSTGLRDTETGSRRIANKTHGATQRDRAATATRRRNPPMQTAWSTEALGLSSYYCDETPGVSGGSCHRNGKVLTCVLQLSRQA